MEAQVSVIIPAYRAAKYLRATVESVLAQTHSVDEIIIVNDGSPDDTLECAIDLAQLHKSIIVVDQPNQGVSAARNHGFSKSKGKFISFLDSDDLWDPNFISSSLSLINHGADISVAASYRFYNSPGDTSDFFGPTSSFVDGFPSSLVRDNMIVPAMVLMKREIVKKVGLFADDSGAWEDWDYWLRCVKSGAIFAFETSGNLVHYRYANQSRSSYLAIGYERCAATLAKHASSRIASKRLFKSHQAKWLRMRGNQEQLGALARNFYSQSIGVDPFAVKSWVKWLLSWVNFHHVQIKRGE